MSFRTGIFAAALLGGLLFTIPARGELRPEPELELVNPFAQEPEPPPLINPFARPHAPPRRFSEEPPLPLKNPFLGRAARFHEDPPLPLKNPFPGRIRFEDEPPLPLKNPFRDRPLAR